MDDKIKLATDCLRTLRVYSPYATRFKTMGACFFEGAGGFWAKQEYKLVEKIKELESDGMTVYAIIHGKYSDLGEIWDFLVLDDDMATVDDVLVPYGNTYRVLSVCCDASLDTIDIGDIGVRSVFGGIVRAW